MTLSIERAIDRWVGTPMCFALNLVACALGWLLRRDHRIRPNPRVIVVSKYLGLGSLINASPLLRGLRQANPESVIVFLGTASTASVVRRIVDVDTVLLVDDTRPSAFLLSVVTALVRLWSLRPDLFIDLEVYSKFSSLIATLSCARNRVGLFLDTTLFRSRLHTHLVYFNRFQHISDVYRTVASAVGIPNCPTDLEPLRVDESEREEAAAFLFAHGMLDDIRPLVIVNPNAGELSLERRWPLLSFASVVEELTKTSRVWLVLSGSADEARYTERVYCELSPIARESVRISAGKLSLGGFLALLARADLVVSNDSGPFHLAHAMGVKTVSLWGPGTPLSYGPSGGDHVVVRSNIYCSPCLYLTDRPPCRGHNRCMQAIPVSAVLEGVRMLREPRGGQRGPFEIVVEPDRLDTPDSRYTPGIINIRSSPGVAGRTPSVDAHSSVALDWRDGGDGPTRMSGPSQRSA